MGDALREPYSGRYEKRSAVGPDGILAANPAAAAAAINDELRFINADAIHYGVCNPLFSSSDCNPRLLPLLPVQITRAPTAGTEGSPPSSARWVSPREPARKYRRRR